MLPQSDRDLEPITLYKPDLTNERTATGKTRWIPISESPLSRAATYKALELGWWTSVVMRFPGSKRERRFIDSESIDRYFQKLMLEQQGENTFSTKTPKKRKAEGSSPDQSRP
jgi:hypothetical protein